MISVRRLPLTPTNLPFDEDIPLQRQWSAVQRISWSAKQADRRP